MKKARKFKKKLAPKIQKRKIESVLSVELIGKENVEKIRALINRVISGLRRHRSNKA